MSLHRVLVSAGDPSGDLILSHVIEALKAQAPARGLNLEFVGLCGPSSEAQGVKIVAHSRDVAVVGISEVFKNLPKLFGILGKLGQVARTCQSVLLVDFPDFNLRLAALARKVGVPVDQIVAPQVWAWRSGRIPQIVRALRSLYPALGFEEGIFSPRGLRTRYMGHPMRDILEPRNRRGARENLSLDTDSPVLLWMPGSRKNEIQKHLGLFLESWAYFEAHSDQLVGAFKNIERWKILLPLAPGWNEKDFLESAGLNTKKNELFKRLVEQKKLFVLPQGQSRVAQMAADFGWIASGTATLEAGFYQLPHILVYKLSGFSAFVIRSQSDYFNPQKRGFVGLPNILLEREVIPELLQSDLTPKRLAIESLEILGNTPRLTEIRKNLRWIPKKMGEPGVTSRIAADLLDLWTSP